MRPTSGKVSRQLRRLGGTGAQHAVWAVAVAVGRVISTVAVVALVVRSFATESPLPPRECHLDVVCWCFCRCCDCCCSI